MAEDAGPGMRSVPAPYIADTCSLIEFAAPSDDVLFYRTDDRTISNSMRDRFAAGEFVLQECLWPTFVSSNASSKFDKLSTAKGALVGYLSYEAGLMFEQRWHQKLVCPASGHAWRFAEVPCWYEADHITQTGEIMLHETAPDCAVDSLRELINGAERSAPVKFTADPKSFPADSRLVAMGELTKDAYEAAVTAILGDISAGRYYELNFTQRFRFSSYRHPAMVFGNLFRNLMPRRGFYMSMAGETVCSLSPELYLQKCGDRVMTIPIKGSMTGAPNSYEWEKLQAEHVMVVDLARNDIGRVSNISPVQVREFMRRNNFGGLNHLESVIIGRTSLDWKQIISLTYPAASITGAPKVEVVSAIQGYEISPRNIYTGTCGWILPNGNLDLNVAIRTAVATESKGEWHFELGGGGAIVADSHPSDEYFECLRKVAPLINGIVSE